MQRAATKRHVTIWFIFILLSITVFCVLIVISTRSQIEEDLSALPLETEVVATKQIETPEPISEDVTNENLSKVQSFQLQELLNSWVEEQDGEFAVVIQEINGLERSASYRAREPMISASTYKLFLAYAILHEVETTDLELSSKNSLNRTIEDCLESLLYYSWDVCAYPTGQMIGWEKLNSFIVASGFEDTDINNYDKNGDFNGDKYTTAQDEADFMQLLEAGELLNEQHTDLIIGTLKEQKWRERIPAGIPSGIEVADKPGWLDDIENDAAIVYGPGPTQYVLVILSDKSSEKALAELSKEIYTFFENNPLPESMGITDSSE